MLIARGHTHVGKSDLRWGFGFTRAVWCVAIRRTGLVLDTRLVPASRDDREGSVSLYLVVHGSFEVHGGDPRSGQRFEGPAAFIVSEEGLEGARGERPFTFTAAGEPYAAIELHFRADDLTVSAEALPRPVELGSAVWEAAAAVTRIARDDAAFERDVATLFERIARTALASRSVARRIGDDVPRTFTVLWSAVRPMIERFYLTPTLKELGDGAGVSLRHIDRYIEEFATSFSVVGKGWRQTTRHLRLKMAVMLLSADDVSVAEVASAVGYRSSDAMSRAFRDAGLPPPREVQEDVRRRRASSLGPAE